MELSTDSEFEKAIIRIVEIHRQKSKIYSNEKDPFTNFILGAEQTNSTPLRYGENLLGKHLSAIKIWWERAQYVDGIPILTKHSTDAYEDRAVYGIILLCLYYRELGE